VPPAPFIIVRFLRVTGRDYSSRLSFWAAVAVSFSSGGHGDVEIEGLVSAVLLLDPVGESRFTIDGKTVVARPGETAIREGNQAPKPRGSLCAAASPASC